MDHTKSLELDCNIFRTTQIETAMLKVYTDGEI